MEDILVYLVDLSGRACISSTDEAKPSSEQPQANKGYTPVVWHPIFPWSRSYKHQWNFKH